MYLLYKKKNETNIRNSLIILYFSILYYHTLLSFVHFEHTPCTRTIYMYTL